MKKLLLILLFTSISFGQSSSLLLMSGDDNPYNNQETLIYANSLTTALSDSQMTNIDNFITMLKDSLSITSLSQKFDAMYILANETAEAGLKNLVKRSHDATAVNSPTFTQWEGFAGNGSSSYLNTNYNVTTQRSAVSANNQSIGIYSRTDKVEDKNDMGVIINSLSDTSTSRIAIMYNATSGFVSLGRSAAATVANSLGLFVGSRTASTTLAIYQNGTLLSMGAQSGTGTGISMNGNHYICAINRVGGAIWNFSTRQYSFSFIGAGLTATEVRQVYNCIQAYMTGIGKQV